MDKSSRGGETGIQKRVMCGGCVREESALRTAEPLELPSVGRLLPGYDTRGSVLGIENGNKNKNKNKEVRSSLVRCKHRL